MDVGENFLVALDHGLFDMFVGDDIDDEIKLVLLRTGVFKNTQNEIEDKGAQGDDGVFVRGFLLFSQYLNYGGPQSVLV